MNARLCECARNHCVVRFKMANTILSFFLKVVSSANTRRRGYLATLGAGPGSAGWVTQAPPLPRGADTLCSKTPVIAVLARSVASDRPPASALARLVPLPRRSQDNPLNTQIQS